MRGPRLDDVGQLEAMLVQHARHPGEQVRVVAVRGVKKSLTIDEVFPSLGFESVSNAREQLELVNSPVRLRFFRSHARAKYQSASAVFGETPR